MKLEELIGNYRIDKHPNLGRMSPHNAESWDKIDKAISKSGGVSSFDALNIAVKDHESGSKGSPHPYQFIDYCVKNGWLKKVK